MGAGAGGNYAAAGTVYLKTAAGLDTLIIDNNNTVTATSQISTLMPPAPNAVNLNNITNVLIRNKGILGVRGDTTLDFTTFAPTTYGPANSYVAIDSDTNVTYPADWTIAGYTLVAQGVSKTLGNVTIGTNAAMSHYANFSTETYKLILNLSGNLTVLSNGTISADVLGYYNVKGPGALSGTYGGAYGGDGSAWTGSGSGVKVNPNTYGSIIAPTNIGSAGGGNNNPGGGAILLTVGGTTTVAAAGSITASGGNGSQIQGSGGSIYLRTGWLSGGGGIRANGGGSSWNGGGSGGGGRVAIVLTGSGADFSTWTGTNTAYGGYGGANGYSAAAGTVYRQAGGVLPGAGTVIVDNGGTATNITCTTLLAMSNLTENISRTFWVVTNKAFLGLVTNVTLASLTINSNSYVNLAGYTGTVSILTITNLSYGGGTYAASALGPLVSDSSGGTGRVIVAPAGLYVDNTGVLEGGSGTTTNAVFTLRLLAVTAPVTFDWYTTNGTAAAGSDYVATSGTLTVSAYVPQTNILVTVNGYDWIGSNKTFQLVVTNVSGTTVQVGAGLCTITNGNARTLSVTNLISVNQDVNGTQTNANFLVTLSQAIGTPVTFQYNTQDGTATVADGDYNPTNGAGVLAPWQTATTLTVVVNGDSNPEPFENFYLALSALSSNATLGNGTGTCTIVNLAAPPALSINSVSVSNCNTGTTNAVFTVSLSKVPASTVTFQYNTQDGSALASANDYIPVAGGSGMIPAGQSLTTLAVQVVGNWKVQSNLAFYVVLSNPTNASILTPTGACTIVNDNYPFIWTGASSNGFASNTNNWLWNGVVATRLPGSNDQVQLDSTSSSNLIWNAGTNGLSYAVTSWTQTASYTGVVTFSTMYGTNGFTNFTVSGNATLGGGTWTHLANLGGQTNRLCVTVGGNLWITNATIVADGLGYTGGTGPGYASGCGASYGGAGCIYSGSGLGANKQTYGSIFAPTNLGSAGGQGGSYPGGGAILLAVAGTTTVAHGTTLPPTAAMAPIMKGLAAASISPRAG